MRLTDEKIVERTRHYMKARWPLAAGLTAVGLVGVAIIDYFAFAQIMSIQTWSAVFWIFHAVIGACALAMFYWGIKSTRGWNKALAQTHTDELQQRRWRHGLAMVPAWGMLCWLAYHLAGHSYSKPDLLMPIAVGIVLPLSAGQVVGGWRMWGSQIAYMTLADDEFTATLRAKAMAVGYGALLLSVGIGMPMALLWPSATLAIFLVVLWLGVTIPTVYLAWLEYRAERDG